MRKLTLRRPFKCDILVFDTIGRNWIHHCLPKQSNVAYLDLRNQIPVLLSISFFYHLVRNLFRQKITLPGYLSLLWLNCLFDVIRPKIILTCADNNALVSRYAANNPAIKVIFLQNALRDTVGSISREINLPIYFAMGAIEAKIFHSLRLSCQHYHAVGSVKLGLALSNTKKNKRKHFDLCFISHYRPELFSKNSSELFNKIEISQRLLFRSLIKYSSENNLSVVVISKTRETNIQNKEYDYFSSIAKSNSFAFSRADKGKYEFDSYFYGLNSGLIVHPASTLGFELFSVGKKVLFGASATDYLINDWGIDHYFDALPDLVKLQNNTSEIFTEKCERIRTMPDSKYHKITQSHAKNIVSMPNGEYPHDFIRRMISNYLS